MGNENVIKTCSCIGYGAVGRPFLHGLRQTGVMVKGVALRNKSPHREIALADAIPVFPLHALPLAVDLLILAVPDDQIEKIATILAHRANNHHPAPQIGLNSMNPRVAMHFSGRFGIVPLTPLTEKGWLRLAWHPIQTFPKDVDSRRFQGIVVGVTADEDAQPMASELAQRLGTTTWQVREKDRAHYHLAAVLASNFLPVLCSLAASRLASVVKESGEAIRGLLPLVEGMIENLKLLTPAEAMTGPVVRNDLEAVRQHLQGWENIQDRVLYLKLLEAAVDLAQQGGRLQAEQAASWKRFLQLYLDDIK